MEANVQSRDRRWRFVAILLATVLLLASVGCSRLSSQDQSTSSQGGASTAGMPAVQPSPPEATTGSGATDKGALAGDTAGTPAQDAYSAAEQLLVRTALMRLRVSDIDKTLDRIRATTAQFKGQIDDLQVSTDDQTPIYRPLDASNTSGETVPLSAYVTVRVPSDRLAAFSRRVASFGKVLHESANQTDVTQQHIDLTARLKNLRAEEARLRQFLNAAKDVKEMLLVETELSRVRSEIESMQSQLDYLDKQISYGTLTVELQKPAPVVRPTGTDWGFTEAITNGIRGAAAAIRSLITVVIALSPLIVLVLIVGLAIRWFLRRRRGGSAESAEHEDDPTANSPIEESPAPERPAE